MTKFDYQISTTAKYICVQIHPEQIRPNYVEHVSVYYQAEPIVYVLQALSAGLTSIFFGLITNYLYDRAKKDKFGINGRFDLERKLHEQEQKILELEKLLKLEQRLAVKTEAVLHLQTSTDILVKIRNQDPAIEELVEHALQELERRGQDELLKDVDSHSKH